MVKWHYIPKQKNVVIIVLVTDLYEKVAESIVRLLNFELPILSLNQFSYGS